VTDPQPFFDAHVFVCTNRRPDGHPRGCCASKRSDDLRDYMKQRAHDMGLRKVRINAAGCLDRCQLGPTVVIYPEGVWYLCRTKADVDAILETHVRDGGRVERLLLTPDQKRLRPEQLAESDRAP
jgi:(2Fe-2S) ferredoxin